MDIPYTKTKKKTNVGRHHHGWNPEHLSFIFTLNSSNISNKHRKLDVDNDGIANKVTPCSETGLRQRLAASYLHRYRCGDDAGTTRVHRINTSFVLLWRLSNISGTVRCRTTVSRLHISVIIIYGGVLVMCLLHRARTQLLTRYPFI